MKIILLAFVLLNASFSFAQDNAESPKFSTQDPIGRLVMVKDGKQTHYLGYFCLERSKLDGDNNKCIRSQFGRGEDVIFGVDFMGNQVSKQGTWTPVGPVFTPETGEAFYSAGINGKDKSDFMEVWSNIWNQKGFGWSSDPIKVSKDSFNYWLNQLAGFKVPEVRAIDPNFKDIRTPLNGPWNLGKWNATLRFTVLNGGRNVDLCFKLDISGVSGWVYHCYSENNKTLSYHDGSFHAIDDLGNPIVITPIEENGLLYLKVKMKLPAKCIYEGVDGAYASKAEEDIEIISTRLN